MDKYSLNMLNFESLFSFPVIKNEKDGKFGQCIINNIEGMITDDAKFKRIILCGDLSNYSVAMRLCLQKNILQKVNEKKR